MNFSGLEEALLKVSPVQFGHCSLAARECSGCD